MPIELAMSSELTFFSINIQRFRSAKGLSQQALATALDVARTTISNWEKGVAYPLFSDLIKLANLLDVSLNDLVKKPDDGIPTPRSPQQVSPEVSPDPIKPSGSVRFVPPAIAADPEVPYGPKAQGNIVMLDTKVAAGLPANYGNSEYLRDQPRFSLPGHKYRGSGLIALQVEGDSMDPTVRHDDWIIAKLLTDPLLELREGYLYVLVTKDGCVAKRLYRTVTDAFLCKSDNEEYPPYEQAIGPGDQVYKALALFSENLGHRRDGLMDRMIALEKTVLALEARFKAR